MTEERDFNVKKLKSATLDHGSLDSPQFHDGAANHKRKGCQGGCETELPRALDPFPKLLSPFPEATQPRGRLKLAQTMQACILALSI